MASAAQIQFYNERRVGSPLVNRFGLKAPNRANLENKQTKDEKYRIGRKCRRVESMYDP